AATGEDPFKAESLGGVMHRVLSVDPDLSPLPASLRPLVRRALEKEPSARPSARELLLSLINGFTGDPAELLGGGGAAAGTPAERSHDPALGMLAEDARGFLTTAERNLLPDLFLRMVTITDAGDIATRPVSRQELSEGRTAEERAALERVLEVFSYLLGTRGGDIVIARPALAQAWPRLRSWIDDEREGLPVYAGIQAAARHWHANGRRAADLVQGSRLEAALPWAVTGRRHLTPTALERDFLDACEAATRRRVWRRRLLTVTLAVLLVLALLGGTLTVLQNNRIASQRDTAEAGRIAAQADAMRATDPRRAMLLSVAAWRLAHIPATRGSLQNAWAQRQRTSFTDPDTGGETVRRITADGRRLFSVSPRGVRVYDLRTGAAAGGWDDLRITGLTLRGVALSPSGRRLAVVAGDTVRAWDTTTGEPVGERKLVRPWLFDEISYGLGDRWVTLGDMYGAGLWDTRTGRIVRGRDQAAIRDAAYTPSGDLAAVTLSGGREPDRFALLRLPSGKPVAHWHDPGMCAGTAEAVAFSPDGHVLACGTTSQVYLLDMRTGMSLTYRSPVRWSADGPLRFSPDGRLLLAGGKLIRVADGVALLTYRGASEGAGFDGTVLRHLTGGTVVSADVADAVDPVRLPAPAPPPGGGMSGLFGPDGRLVVTQTQGTRSLAVWDATTRRPLGAVGVSSESVFGAPARPAFSGDGRLLAFPDGDLLHHVRVWDTVRRVQVAEIDLPGKEWDMESLAVNGDGSLLAIGASGMSADRTDVRGRLLVWDLRHGRWHTTIDFKSYTSVVFRPGGTTVAEVAGASNRLLDLATGRETGDPIGPGRVSAAPKALAFSPDGNTLATVSGSGVAFWDVRTGDRLGPDLNVTLPGDRVVFSSKGDVAAVATRQGVQLVEVAGPRKLGPVVAVEDPPGLASFAFGSGGAVLRTMDGSGVMREVPVDPERTAAEVCARAGGTLTPDEWRRYLPGVPFRDVCP
ncbi:nSTAND1 domain-containing NTPase, partial [Sphaerisporangium fuscum]|uniref:nSTAND1 domain-containing NTPase n=1 Tax=Sphaerisporangium fuscum TaxID=2835868 RepID=UPI003FD756AF